MAKTYKIHPAIGIMRVGDSPNSFFIGPEKPGQPGTELDGGAELPIQHYKAGGRLKRQAARFRVWEYGDDTEGKLTPIREITAAEAVISWEVVLVNSKAAGHNLVPARADARRVLLPIGSPRNESVTDRESLIIRGGRRTISGVNQPAMTLAEGKFLGTPVYLGELKTDSVGRLLVLGGRGISTGISTVPGGPMPSLGHFANNDRWHDDVSDGPVTATVTFAGQVPIEVTYPAWLICAPPDFAPSIGGVVTLFDIAMQAAITREWLRTPERPRFRRDIFPMLMRSSNLRWVHNWLHWEAVPRDWAALSRAGPGEQALRQLAFEQIVGNTLNEFALPAYLEEMLTAWWDGNFDDDWSAVDSPLREVDALDRASLEACIGANFFPGIEAGYGIADPQVYMEPFRLSHAQVTAGQLTSAMALPWQADFNDCNDDWWPSQRPNFTYRNVADVPNTEVRWARGVSTDSGTPTARQSMVENFAKLGFVVPVEQAGEIYHLEAERDPSLLQT